MKAVVYAQYGSPDVLAIEHRDSPAPRPDQVLVDVHAVSVNPFDWHYMRGSSLPVRAMTGWTKPKSGRLGIDFAGRVTAVGDQTNQYHVGDDVFGAQVGCFAESIPVHEAKLAPKPDNVSFEAAAAVPVAATTALQGLRDRGRIQPGQHVLVYGASGGVGTFAVQIAKSFGADVTGVCSGGNLDMVRDIGADRVIDYTHTDFATGTERYDLIFDTVGKRSYRDSRSALAGDGAFVAMGMDLGGAALSRLTQQRVALMGMANINAADLQTLSDMLAAETIKPVIDRTYAFDDIPAAIRYLEQGHARGKVGKCWANRTS